MNLCALQVRQPVCQFVPTFAKGFDFDFVKIKWNETTAVGFRSTTSEPEHLSLDVDGFDVDPSD